MTSGLMPSLYRLLVLLKLTMLKMTRCSERTLLTAKLNHTLNLRWLAS